MNNFGGIKFKSNLKIIKDLEGEEKIQLLKQLSNKFSMLVDEIFGEEIELINITGEFIKEDSTKWIN